MTTDSDTLLTAATELRNTLVEFPCRPILGADAARVQAASAAQ